MSQEKNLPVTFGIGIDFNQVRNGEVLKFVDGRWSSRGGPELPHGTKMLLRGMRRALQHWERQTLLDEKIEKRGECLPSVKKLNDEIPQSEWERGLDGELRKPWALYHVFYLINDDDGCAFYHSNCTYGQMLAYHELENKLAIDEVKGLQGIPILELHSKSMPTARGLKQRPHYKVFGYFGNGSAQLEREPIEEIEEEHETERLESQPAPTKAKPAKRTGPAPGEELIDDSEPDVTPYDED